LPAILNHVFDHLWQSTLFAGVAGLLTLALRNNRARVRHWIWLAASCKFLIPLSLLIAAGGQIQWRTAPEIPQSGPSFSYAVNEVSQPFTRPSISARAAARRLPVLFSVWIAGFLGIACSWWVRWRRMRATVRAGLPLLELPLKALSTDALLEPGIFGIFRPVLLLPECIFDRLTPEQLKAVIAHELCHVRYRDNLTAAIHMFVETVFWFHPLIWWIGKRMVAERERACDEEVLRLGYQPRVYAEGILNICKLYVESPLAFRELREPT
jgi:bla regulator protein blaR1